MLLVLVDAVIEAEISTLIKGPSALFMNKKAVVFVCLLAFWFGLVFARNGI